MINHHNFALQLFKAPGYYGCDRRASRHLYSLLNREPSDCLAICAILFHYLHQLSQGESKNLMDAAGEFDYEICDDGVWLLMYLNHCPQQITSVALAIVDSLSAKR